MLKSIALGLFACAALLPVSNAKADEAALREQGTAQCSGPYYKAVNNLVDAQVKELDALTAKYVKAGYEAKSAERKAEDDLWSKHVSQSKNVDMDFGTCIDKYVQSKTAIVQEAIKQEQQAPKAKVPAYSIIDILQDPVLKDQLSYCENNDPDAARIRAEAQASFAESTQMYNDEVRFLVANGYDVVQAQREANDKYMKSARADAESNTARIKKFANRCTVREFGWKQK